MARRRMHRKDAVIRGVEGGPCGAGCRLSAVAAGYRAGDNAAIPALFIRRPLVLDSGVGDANHRAGRAVRAGPVGHGGRERPKQDGRHKQ